MGQRWLRWLKDISRMLLPTKPLNYPLIIIHASLFVEYGWFTKKLSSPWLKWFSWEITNVADLFVLGDSKISEDWLDEQGVFITDYIPEEEVKEMGGAHTFIEWLQYGSHPVQVYLPDKEEFHGMPDAVYYEKFEDVEMFLFDLVHRLRKL